MAWTTPRTWVAGEIATAALLNAQLRDNLDAFGTWSTYTVDWTGSTSNPSIGNGTLTGRYAEAGKTVLVYLELVYGSTTTNGSGTMRFSLPTPSRAIDVPTALGGWAYVEDLATVGYYFLPRLSTADNTDAEFVYDDSTVSAGLYSVLQFGQPFTWGTGDLLRGFLFYEAA